MPWLHVSQSHPQPWYWLCGRKKDFFLLSISCAISMSSNDKKYIYLFSCSSKQYSLWRIKEAATYVLIDEASWRPLPTSWSLCVDCYTAQPVDSRAVSGVMQHPRGHKTQKWRNYDVKTTLRCRFDVTMTLIGVLSPLGWPPFGWHHPIVISLYIIYGIASCRNRLEFARFFKGHGHPPLHSSSGRHLTSRAVLCLATVKVFFSFNSSPSGQNGRHFAGDIFKSIFLNENVWLPTKIPLKFVSKGPIKDIPASVQVMVWRRPGDICGTRGRWVNYLEICPYSRAASVPMQVTDVSLPCGCKPGTHPTNDISIEFEIRLKLAVLWFKINYTNHNGILHTSRQYNCRDVCKISLCSVGNVLNWGTGNFDRISNSIEIPLTGRASGLPTDCLPGYSDYWVKQYNGIREVGARWHSQEKKWS